MTNTKMYRYEFTITGKSGDFWFIPMTPEQVAFWQEKGNDALTEHLTGGYEKDGTPSEFELGHYEDFGYSAGGIELEIDGHLIVRDEDGDRCFKRTLWDFDNNDLVVIEGVVVAPPTGGFFRTYEKSEWLYKLELREPFNPSELRLHATDTPEGDLIIGESYADGEILMFIDDDKEYRQHEAMLFSRDD